jgi:hypothetical protein
MRVHYRNHLISIVEGVNVTAQLTDLRTSAVLPTKVTATVDEGRSVLLERAKVLVDLYLTPSTAQLLASNLEHSDAKSS